MTEPLHPTSQAETASFVAVQEQQKFEGDAAMSGHLGGVVAGAELNVNLVDESAPTELPGVTSSVESINSASPFTDGQHFIDEDGDGIEVIKVTNNAIEFDFENEFSVDLTKKGQRWLAKSLPLTESLVSVEGSHVEAPTIDTVKEFSREHLEPLGGSKMEMVLVDGAEFSAELMADYWADGKMPIATNPEFYIHDVTFHGLTVKAMPNASSEVFQGVARASRSIRETDAHRSNKIAVGFAQGFENYFDPERNRFPGKPSLIELFDEFRGDSKALALIEQYLGEAPDITLNPDIDANTLRASGDVFDHPEKYPKIMGWLQWSYEGKASNHMKHVKEVMLQKQEQMAGTQQAA